MKRIQVFEYMKVDKGIMPVKYEKVPTFIGLFHGWGCNYEELNDGVGTYSAAIVEQVDGIIKLVPAENIQFLEAT